MNCQNCGVVIEGPLARHTCDPKDVESYQSQQAAPSPLRAFDDTPSYEKRLVFPLDQVNRDRVYEFWAWYLKPFAKPRITAEGEAWVMGTLTTEPSEGKVRNWQRILATAPTVCGDLSTALTRKPAAIPSEREAYKRRGWHLCQRVEGEIGNGEFPFGLWDPDMDGGHDYLGCRAIIEALKPRGPWAVKQLEARIAALEGDRDGRGVRADQIAYADAGIAAMEDRLALLKGEHLPSANELFAFFKRYERVRLEARQDVRLKEQMALQGAIAANIQAEQNALMAPDPVGAA